MNEAENFDEIKQYLQAKDDASKNSSTRATRNNVCKSFLHNNVCKYANCQYSHDTRRIRICDHFRRGICVKGEDCDFRHDITPCRFFEQAGKCINGANCQYKHIQSVCKNFSRGFCSMGKGCKNLHKRVEKPCLNYMYGFCPNGPNCPDDHVKQFFNFDLGFYEHWRKTVNDNFKLIICNKCKELGHKANRCNIEETFLTKASKTQDQFDGGMSGGMGGGRMQPPQHFLPYRDNPPQQVMQRDYSHGSGVPREMSPSHGNPNQPPPSGDFSAINKKLKIE